MKKFEIDYPLKYVNITQGYGENADYYQKWVGIKAHNGLDMVAPDGTEVFAAHDGVVTYAGEDGAGGLIVVIRTNEEFDWNGTPTFFKSIYCHLKKDNIFVKASQSVKKGYRIALSDNTGLSTGSHLHFGIKPIAKGEQEWQWYNVEQQNGFGGAVDPMQFLPKLDYFHTELQKGDTGVEVVRLQTFLMEKGFLVFKGEPTLGNYGDMTAQAVLDFQLKYCKLSWYERNILKGSKVGQKTLSALNFLYYGTNK